MLLSNPLTNFHFRFEKIFGNAMDKIDKYRWFSYGSSWTRFNALRFWIDGEKRPGTDLFAVWNLKSHGWVEWTEMEMKRANKFLCFTRKFELRVEENVHSAASLISGGVAPSVISASEKFVYVADLRLGVLFTDQACWRFVRSKLVINIDHYAEALVV